MKTSKIYQRHRYPSSIISHCVWLYYRFTLSYRDIELIMMEKGISLTYESIRYWCLKFGKLYAKRIKKTNQYGAERRFKEWDIIIQVVPKIQN